jgi:hypothetical protein
VNPIQPRDSTLVPESFWQRWLFVFLGWRTRGTFVNPQISPETTEKFTAWRWRRHSCRQSFCRKQVPKKLFILGSSKSAGVWSKNPVTGAIWDHEHGQRQGTTKSTS